MQLTGEDNYERAEDRLRTQYPALVEEFERRTGQTFDLTDFPDQATDPAIAYAIMALGMYQGWFTSRKFATYLNHKKIDYVNARRIINGTDKAEEIAVIAVAFEKALRESIAQLGKQSAAAQSAGALYTTNDEPEPSEAAAATPPEEANERAETPTQLQHEPEANKAEPSMFDRIGNSINQTRDIVATVQERAGEVKETVTTVTDIVGLPGTRPQDLPMMVTRGRLARRLMTFVGFVFSTIGTVFGAVLNNWKLIALGIVLFVLISVVFIAATVALDYVRLKYFSDPKRYNVE